MKSVDFNLLGCWTTTSPAVVYPPEIPMKTPITAFTDEELEAEMDRREAEREAAKRPKPIENPDFSILLDNCAEYIKQLSANGYYDDDLKDYVFEAAVEAIYGRDIWDWVAEKQGD